MINIPVLSEEFGYQISALFYQLSRPNPDPNDVSRYYCPVEQHPVSGYWYLRMPDDDEFPISKKASTVKLVNALKPFREAGIIDNNDLETIKIAIAQNKGKKIIPNLFFPGYWKELAVADSDFELKLPSTQSQ